MTISRSEPYHPSGLRVCPLCNQPVHSEGLIRIIAFSPGRGFKTSRVFSCCNDCGKKPDEQLAPMIEDTFVTQYN